MSSTTPAGAGPAPTPLHEDPDIQRRRWFLLGVMCLSLVMVVMSVSGLNVALPTIQRELGTSQTALQWIVDAYALVFAGLLLTAGAMGDRFGRKLTLLVGFGLFGLGAAIAGLATTSAQVIAGRGLMGVGAAFIMPATLSIITAIFAPAERGRAIAIWAGFAGAGGAIGPIVSGGLLERFWWGSTLLFNVPVVIVVASAVAFFSPRTRDEQQRPLDPVGACLSLVGVTALVFGIIEGPEQGWSDPAVLAAFLVAGSVIGAFLAWEHRRADPMLPLRLFTDRRFSVGSGAVTCVAAVMFGFFFLFVQYLQYVLGYTPLQAGLAGLPMAATLIIVAPRSAGLAERFGYRTVVTTGFTLVGAGFVVFTTASPTSAYIELVAGFVLVGAGMASIVAPSTGSIMSAVPVNQAGVGSAVNDTSRELGGALGIAVLGSVVTSQYQTALSTGSLPGALAGTADDSVSGALAIADRIGGPQGAQFAAEVSRSFTDAFTTAVGVAAVIAVISAVLVFTVAPRRTGAIEKAGPELGGDDASVPLDTAPARD